MSKIISSQGIITSKVTYARAVYGKEEIDAVVRSLNNNWLASGPLVKQFEEEIAKLFGKKYGVAVNSGSSANLLAIKALNLPKGSEVITPACTFATTVSEIINNHLIPVFVDSVIGRYTINEELIEKAITPQTKAIVVPQLIGGICDMNYLKKLAKERGLLLLDDSCDTLAPYIGDKTVASFADVTTTSFYGSHIITACGMGGMVLTDSEQIRDRVITLRDWGRVGNDQEEFDDRFNFKIDDIPYDAKFLYSEFGYNLKMNESAAAFGLEQVKKLPKFMKQRHDNFEALYQFFIRFEDWFYMPKLIEGATTNWLAFPLTIKEGAPFTRYELLRHLESKGIQTRVLFSGNIIRHPVYKRNGFMWRSASPLKNADYIMANGFLLGCHQGMGQEEVDYIAEAVEEFFKKI
jgi:CDP-4-dehydro-6-deoxyglucose reductase, E1